VKTHADWSLKPGLEGSYQFDGTSGHALRLNSWTGIEVCLCPL